MKRVLLLCLACMMLVSAVASAEVKKDKDSFTGGINAGSYTNLQPFFNTMYFRKTMSDGYVTYEFSISRIGGKNSILGDAPIEIKIDQYPVYELRDIRYRSSGPDSYGVKHSSSISVKIPADLADKIREAKRVAFQYEEVNGMRWPYVLPDDVLAEWKEVINTEA